ncbi:MAG TPA: hypothetical protein VFF81_08845 [Noviherbaspirillum sp.]|nr:hypothetical protein [Noviherbaspirillum sp.]
MATSTKPELKQSPAAGAPSPSNMQQEATQSEVPANTLSAQDKFKAAIEELDAERTALVKNTIENLKPGKPFDHTVIRAINKIETKKNRLIISRFAAMLKKNEPGIIPIVHQIIDI